VEFVPIAFSNLQTSKEIMHKFSIISALLAYLFNKLKQI